MDHISMLHRMAQSNRSGGFAPCPCKAALPGRGCVSHWNQLLKKKKNLMVTPHGDSKPQMLHDIFPKVEDLWVQPKLIRKQNLN